MKRIDKKYMVIALACMLIISGCSSNRSNHSPSPKQVLSDALEYSDQLEGFHEEYEDSMKSEESSYHLHSSNYAVFPSQKGYMVCFLNAVEGSYKQTSIFKYTQTDMTYIQGTPSSSSFNDMTVTVVGSYDERNDVYIDKKYFSSIFEDLVANDVSNYVDFEMDKNEKGYLITITISDVDRFNEINKEKTIEEYGEDLFDPYLEFCMTVQINNGLVQKITWDIKRDNDGVIQERDMIATYTPCSFDKVNTGLIDDLTNNAKSRLISEGSYLSVHDVVQ